MKSPRPSPAVLRFVNVRERKPRLKKKANEIYHLHFLKDIVLNHSLKGKLPAPFGEHPIDSLLPAKRLQNEN